MGKGTARRGGGRAQGQALEREREPGRAAPSSWDLGHLSPSRREAGRGQGLIPALLPPGPCSVTPETSGLRSPAGVVCGGQSRAEEEREETRG